MRLNFKAGAKIRSLVITVRLFDKTVLIEYI